MISCHAGILSGSADFVAMQERIADLEDLALIAERRHEPTLSLEAVERHLAGVSLVTLWREDRGLSQRALAGRAGLSASMLNEIETGKKTPSLATAKALAEALGLTLNDLFE